MVVGKEAHEPTNQILTVLDPGGSSRQNPNDPRGSGLKARGVPRGTEVLESKGDLNKQSGLVDCSRPKGLSVLQSELTKVGCC